MTKRRALLTFVMVLLVALSVGSLPGAVASSMVAKSLPWAGENPIFSAGVGSSDSPGYLVVGGQTGTWGTFLQYPSLYEVGLGADGTATPLSTIGGRGTVWSGGFSGSEWLISGWGTGKYLNPYFSLYNDSLTGKERLSDYPQVGGAEQEWAGGDIFTVGWNGTTWLLAGLGQGALFQEEGPHNHMSLAFLSPTGDFTDLSQDIPGQMDMILYASAWNGEYWLVGGGWYGWHTGVLYMVSGNDITDITSQISVAVPTFSSIQSIAWNGKYFLIGGVGFLAAFNGTDVIDLTSLLDLALGPSRSLGEVINDSVNAIAWTGQGWMLAGGTPVAAYEGIPSNSAWVASFGPALDLPDFEASSFTDLTTKVLPGEVVQGGGNSTILTLSCAIDRGCAIGGADSAGGLLVWYDGAISVDLSSTVVQNMAYVQWVGISSLPLVRWLGIPG